MTDPDEVAEAGIIFLENMDPMLDMVDGYRAKLLARGYSETIAEVMTMEFHKMCIDAMAKQNDV